MPSKVSQVINGSQLDWSSDGTKFVFVKMNADIDGSGVTKDILCTMNKDGTELRKIAYSSVDPRWSINGLKILCSCGRLVLLDADKNYINVEHCIPKYLCGQSVFMGQYSWSPDGTNIAFTSGSGLYLVNADGSNLRCIKQDDLGDKRHISWSPDGCWLVYKDQGIKTIHTSNSSHKIISSRGGFPSWNPVNNTIAFYVSPKFQHFDDKEKLPTEIRILNFDTDKLEAISIGNAEIQHNTIQSLVWSPNGKYLAFQMETFRLFRKSLPAIYTLNVKTKKFIKVIDGIQAGDSSIKWSPDSTKLAVCLVPDFHTKIIELEIEAEKT
jgi:Tol biopolymer transport system component